MTAETTTRSSSTIGLQRQIPGRATPCERCGEAVLLARTMASPSGSGGRLMPLELVEHPEGRVAVIARAKNVLYCRQLQADETVDRPWEYQAIVHFPRCEAVLLERSRRRRNQG